MPDKTTFQVTPKKQFLALLKEADQKKDKLQSISGELGARIKEASENGHLNRGAFGLMVKLHRMEEDKRADFLRSFDAYREFAGEAQLWGSEHVGDLVDEAQRDEAAEQQAADEAQVAANVEALEQGITPLPDAGTDEDFERGRIAFLDGKAGVIPADLEGKPAQANRFLEGWSSMSELSVEERSKLNAARNGGAARENDAEFDDATSKKPSRRRGARVGEEPGSYSLAH